MHEQGSPGDDLKRILKDASIVILIRGLHAERGSLPSAQPDDKDKVLIFTPLSAKTNAAP
ncbi:hypothetical protein M1E08_10695 [Erwinia sp. PK3-005]|uniref:Uncharacterized protein n=1 Tax=Mixta hanseatica TaxID=2872648 RepID=A0ABY4RD05_9GAMM|nr:hypothetical protein [Mixta hanseatica]UQY45989.1 hypothetical protein K6958_10300 [Mixta hanseatica]